MPRKTFHFEPEPDKALVDLFGAYLTLSALVEASASTLEEGGLDASYVRLILKKCDQIVVKALRYGPE